MKKRGLLLFLVLCLILAAAVFPVAADDIAGGTCGENLTWRLTSTGCLIISGEGPMDDFEDTGKPWAGYLNYIYTLEIGDGVTTISSHAFRDCTTLYTADIGSGVVSVGVGVFEGCEKLYSVSVSAENTALYYDGDLLIDRNTQTVLYVSTHVEGQIAVPDGVRSIGTYAFEGCKKITAVTLPDSLQSIGSGAFQGCNKLGSIALPDSIKCIEDSTFAYCIGLTEIGLPDSLESIGSSAFYACVSLAQIQLPASVSRIGTYAFSECEFSEFILPEQVTVIEAGTFYRCVNLKSISFSENIVSIGDRAFRDCDSLTDVWFAGDAPAIGNEAFSCGHRVTLHYTLTNETWDPESYYRIGNVKWDACCPDHHYESEAFPPTCTEQGYTYNECPTCEDSYKDAYVDSFGGHQYETEVTAVSCTEHGRTTYTCTVCGDTYSDSYMLATRHQYGDWSLEQAATCTENGTEGRVCGVCGYHQIHQIFAKGHDYRNDVCEQCGITLAEAEAADVIVDAAAYDYTITPILAPFTYYLYVQTDNPDPTSFRLVDPDSRFYEPDSYGKIEIPGYPDEETVAPGTYYCAPALFPDVEYEDESIFRVAGGYIFEAHSAYSDGGEFVLMQKTCSGVNILEDQFEATGVMIPCQPLSTYFSHLLDTCISDDKTFFENLDAVQEYLEDYSVYPQGLCDVNSPNPNMPYPCLAAAYYRDQSINEHYELFERTDDYMLAQLLYPYVMDSLGFPNTIRLVAEELSSECIVEYTGNHYEVKITLADQSHTYGGAGLGDPIRLFRDRVQPAFNFRQDGEDAASFTMDQMRHLLLTYHGTAYQDILVYWDLIRGDTFTDNIKSTGGTWIKLAIESTASDGKAFTYAMVAEENTYASILDDAWVDGRYIDSRRVIQLHERFEDHPTANIVLTGVTYTDRYGVTRTGPVQYVYFPSHDVWATYLHNPGASSLDELPDAMVLTREEVERLDPDRNTDHLPESCLNYDGSVYPGTPFEIAVVTGVRIPETLELTEGDRQVIQAQLEPADAYNPRVTWSSSDPSVVDFSDSTTGSLRCLAEGTAVLTVTTFDGAYSASCTVTVLPLPCKNGHSFTAYVSDGNAACEADGTQTAKCDHCEETDTVPDPGTALGHNHEHWYIGTDPTCTADGEEWSDCTRCGKRETRTIQTAGHQFNAEVTEPGCTEQGYTTNTCRVCGYHYLGDYTDPTDHRFGQWTVITPAAPGIAGEQLCRCEICGLELTEPIPPLDWPNGDMNKDGIVSSDDAVYLLYFTLFGESLYPVEQDCDFDGSGGVGADDAIYLLYYTLFGDALYPLNA